MGDGPRVGIVGGSRSDFPVLEKAQVVLDELGVACELRVVSAHRTPDHLFAYAETAEQAMRALVRKASMARAMGIAVNLCGKPEDSLERHQSRDQWA